MVMLIPKEAGFGSPEAFQNSASTDQDGRFEQTGLAAGRYVLQALEMTGAQGSSGLRPLGEVLLEASQTTSVEFRLPEASAGVKGVVIKAGQPLSGTQVMIYKEGNLLDGFAQTTTDEEGRFEAKGLSAGTYVASANGAVKTTFTLSDEAQVELRLEIKAGVVAGSIVGPGGRPAAGATVKLLRLDSSSFEDVFKDQSPSDALGTFRIEDVRPGRYRILARSPGLGVTAGLEFTLGAEEARTDLALQLGAGGTLNLEVSRADTQPAAGAGVTLYHLELGVSASLSSGWNGSATPVTDSRGRVSLAHLIPGTYALFVATSSQEQAVLGSLEIPEGATTAQRLSLAPSGALEVQAPPGSAVELTLSGSKTPVGASAAPWAQAFGLARTGPDGLLNLSHLPAVAIDVRATTPEGRSLSWTGKIASGEKSIAILR